jgi:hypothetical protein
VSTYTFVNFAHKEAAELARLKSIHFDLWSVIQLCEFFEAQCAESAHGYASSEISDAFSTAILVRYSRAFASGVRRGLGEEALGTFTIEQRASHDHLRAYRDKHVAHSVNAFEETQIQARFCLERVEQEGITGVSAVHYRVVGLGSKDVSNTIGLCKTLLGFVDAEIHKEEERLLAHLRAMSLSDVLSNPSEPALIPDHSKIGKRRAGP